MGILVPTMVLTALLLAHSAALEREQLEARLIQVADDLADDLDRDIARDFTLLQTLATSHSFASEDWVAAQGPNVTIDGRMAQTFALLLQELATNAAKHGSLSDPNGKVAITWSLTGTGACARLQFKWEERDGPIIKPPSRPGFGSSLLKAALPTGSGIEPRVGFEPGGFVYEVDVPLSTLRGK